MYEWACSHITFAHKGIAERKKSERGCSCSCIGLHLSNSSKVEGKVHVLTSYFPFTVLTVNYKVGCPHFHINHVLFIITFHFLF